MLLYNAKGGDAQNYKLRNGDGDRATISMRREVLANGNGSVVGEQHWQCLASDVFWYCTGVIALTDAARTGAGDITFAGLFKGFNGESLAITGGTGAYAATRGTIVLKVDQGEFVRVLKLV
jgi:hypothetical protein